MKRWRKAVIFSLILNMAGVVAVSQAFFAENFHEKQETVVELELWEAPVQEGAAGKTVSGQTDPGASAYSEVSADRIQEHTTRKEPNQLAVNSVTAGKAEYKNENSGEPQTVGAGSGAGNPGEGKIASEGRPAGKIISPQVLNRIEPVYPEAARKQGLQGRVKIRIELTAAGIPGNVGIDSSSGYAELDQAAVQAARQWRFVPAREEGRGAIPCVTTVTLVFSLQ